MQCKRALHKASAPMSRQNPSGVLNLGRGARNLPALYASLGTARLNVRVRVRVRLRVCTGPAVTTLYGVGDGAHDEIARQRVVRSRRPARDNVHMSQDPAADAARGGAWTPVDKDLASARQTRDSFIAMPMHAACRMPHAVCGIHMLISEHVDRITI